MNTLYHIIVGLVLWALAGLATQTRAASVDNPITRIAFGSCAKESKPQPVWTAVNADRPDLFIFLGDNIYADTTEPEVLAKKYQTFAAQPGFKTLKSQTRLLATWDDHDYGQNDAGRENPIKHQSRQQMLDFWQEPQTSPRRTQAGGIYSAHYFGDADHRIQVLLLDLRWNRTPLQTVDALAYADRKKRDMGPYSAITDSKAVYLGEAQWRWMEQELQKPAQIRILASSLQFLADFTGWEAWANFPAEQARFYQLIRKHAVNGLLIISGDTHWAELSRKTQDLPYPLYDLTSSGLTEEWHAISPNKYRISKAFAKANYGMITIDWQANPIALELEIKDSTGQPLISHHLDLAELSGKSQ